MAAIVVFDYAGFIARYPEFGQVPQARCQAFFDEAGLYLRNDGTSPVRGDTSQRLLMNMLTAHIAALNAQAPGGAGQANTLVGRIESATEGSVTVGTSNDYPPGSAQWFQQTKYGAAFWQASAQYRTMHYIPAIGHGVGGAYGSVGVPGGGPFPGFPGPRGWGGNF